MLSYQQFVSKHDSKPSFASLRKKEKRARYRDYLASESKNPPVTRSATPKSHSVQKFERRNQSLFSTGTLDGVASTTDYLKSVADPVAHKSCYPGNPYPVVPVRLRRVFTLTSDSHGNVIFLARDGITRSTLTTWLAATGSGGPSTLNYSPPEIPNAPNNAQLETTFVGKYFSGSDNTTAPPLCAKSLWDANPAWEEVRSTSTAYRPVSGGCVIRYIGAPLNASGRWVAAPLHTTTGLSSRNQLNGGRIDSDAGFTYDAVQSLDGAASGKALDGAYLRMIPYGNVPSFRPTKYVLSGQALTVTALKTSKKVPPGDHGAVLPEYVVDVDPSCCDVDTDVYQSLVGTVQMLQLSDDIATIGNDCYLYPWAQSSALALQGAPSTIGVSFNAGLFQDLHLGTGLSGIVFMATGLPASTEVFEVEMVLNVELIPDESTFSAVSLARSGDAAIAHAAASHMPVSVGPSVAPTGALFAKSLPAMAEKALSHPAVRKAGKILMDGASKGLEIGLAGGSLVEAIEGIGSAIAEGGSVADFIPAIAALLA